MNAMKKASMLCRFCSCRHLFCRFCDTVGAEQPIEIKLTH
jgi:hypothetical protein